MLQVDVVAERQRPMVLHWAVNDWQLPPADAQPAGTVQVHNIASRQQPVLLLSQ